MLWLCRSQQPAVNSVASVSESLGTPRNGGIAEASNVNAEPLRLNNSLPMCPVWPICYQLPLVPPKIQVPLDEKNHSFLDASRNSLRNNLMQILFLYQKPSYLVSWHDVLFNSIM